MRYVFGDCTFDTACYALHRAGVRIPLRPKVFQLLAYLITHRDRVVLKDELVSHLWPQQFVGDAALKSCILTARKALGDAGRSQRFIQTLHGHGYRFVAAVTTEDQPVPTNPPRPTPPRASAPPAPTVESAPGLGGGLLHLSTHALEQEYKQVTVLWCTLAHAPALAIHLGPEAMHSLMHEVLAVAQRTVQRYEGTITQYLGDGFLALFGAPVAQEDHARRAVLAALDLQQRLRMCRTGLALPQHTTLAACMGLHTGPIVVGALDHDPQRLYTALGETTHVVTRLHSLAAPGAVVTSEATYRLICDEVWADACGSLEGAESAAPVAVYTVRGMLRHRAGVPRRHARDRVRFVGRTREFAILQERLASAVQGQGQVVGLVGEPGMGKSRLVYEFAQSVTGHAVTYHEGHCLAYASTTPYLLMRNLFQQLCGLGDAETPERIATSVDRYVRQRGIVPEEGIPVLRRLLDVLVDAPPLQGSPEDYKAWTFALLQQVILCESRRQPLILAVENLHWIDATSEEWLTTLVERLAGTAILLLATYRPGYRPTWLDKSYATQLALPRLTPQESGMVVQAVAHTALLPEHLTQEIIAKAAGNPFFLEELTRSVQEEGRHHTVLTIPDTIQAVLAARIDRLSSEVKHLLQTAAVIGTAVPLPLVQAVAALPEAALHRGLAHLQAAEFLYETRLFPEREYTFTHALTQQVAYETLVQTRRRVLHARIVEALEALAGDRVAEQVERLAHHAVRGEVWDKAVTYCQQAGARAHARAAFREAVAYVDQALEALHYLPPGPDTQTVAIDLHLALRNALYPLSELERIFEVLQAAAALAEPLDVPHRRGWIAAYLLVHFNQTGEPDHSLAAGQRALATAEALGDVDLLVTTQHYLGNVARSLGAYQQAIAYCRKNMAVADRASPQAHYGLPGPAAIFARSFLVCNLAECGAFAEARARAEEGVRLAEAADQPLSRVLAYWAAGTRALYQGDLHHAIPVLARACTLGQDAHFLLMLPRLALYLGAAYTLAGRLTEALSWLEQAVEQALARRVLLDHALQVTWLGETLWRAGRLEEAGVQAQHALEFARAHQERGHEAYALRLLGDIATHRDPPEVEPAEAQYHLALALAEALGMRPLQAHCHHGLGTLYGTVGQWVKAHTALSTAMAMYQAMDMTFWLPQTEAVLVQMEGR
jgi:class 3 adenylate cyclase/tetratricopeptide (TPR) repeat protein